MLKLRSSVLLALMLVSCGPRVNTGPATSGAASAIARIEANEKMLKAFEADVAETTSTSYSADMLRQNPDMRAVTSSRDYRFASDAKGWRIDALAKEKPSPGHFRTQTTVLGIDDRCFSFVTWPDRPGHASAGMVLGLPMPPYAPLMFGFRARMKSLAEELREHHVTEGTPMHSEAFGTLTTLHFDTEKDLVTIGLSRGNDLFPVSLVFRRKSDNPDGYTEEAFEVDSLTQVGGIWVPARAHWEYRAVVLGDVATRTRADIMLSHVTVNKARLVPIDYGLPSGTIFTDSKTGEEFVATTSGVLEHHGWQGSGANLSGWLLVGGVTWIMILALGLLVRRLLGSRASSLPPQSP